MISRMSRSRIRTSRWGCFAGTWAIRPNSVTIWNAVSRFRPVGVVVVSPCTIELGMRKLPRGGVGVVMIVSGSFPLLQLSPARAHLHLDVHRDLEPEPLQAQVAHEAGQLPDEVGDDGL